MLLYASKLCFIVMASKPQRIRHCKLSFPTKNPNCHFSMNNKVWIFSSFFCWIVVGATWQSAMKKARTMSTETHTESSMKDGFSKYAEYLNNLVKFLPFWFLDRFVSCLLVYVCLVIKNCLFVFSLIWVIELVVNLGSLFSTKENVDHGRWWVGVWDGGDKGYGKGVKMRRFGRWGGNSRCGM